LPRNICGLCAGREGIHGSCICIWGVRLGYGTPVGKVGRCVVISDRAPRLVALDENPWTAHPAQDGSVQVLEPGPQGDAQGLDSFRT
jgi:hypothetical protein